MAVVDDQPASRRQNIGSVIEHFARVAIDVQPIEAQAMADAAVFVVEFLDCDGRTPGTLLGSAVAHTQAEIIKGTYRHLEEMMEERGVIVDHSSINRWAIRFLPLLEKVFRKHKRPVGGSWRMDETYIKIKGAWKYLYPWRLMIGHF
jgi:hypothetical protein